MCYVLKDRTKTRAETKSVLTARLPIDVYMERKSEPGNHSFSKVLTVNQGRGQIDELQVETGHRKLCNLNFGLSFVPFFNLFMH